mmetsp:Transcript_30598/g.65999  ORF Transcript_30598/g.65999 Transcript_30598/m.65999 type:complete len:211 (-) Transcript_30598:2038-2670(-)
MQRRKRLGDEQRLPPQLPRPRKCGFPCEPRHRLLHVPGDARRDAKPICSRQHLRPRVGPRHSGRVWILLHSDDRRRRHMARGSPPQPAPTTYGLRLGLPGLEPHQRGAPLREHRADELAQVLPDPQHVPDLPLPARTSGGQGRLRPPELRVLRRCERPLRPRRLRLLFDLPGPPSAVDVRASHSQRHRRLQLVRDCFVGLPGRDCLAVHP